MLDSPPVWMWVIGFLLVLGPLVTLHEFGHYLVARLCGVKSEVFSVGFGREVFGRTDRHGTRWRLSALPLGGYVQFAGDMNPASQPSPEWLALPEEERKATFQAQPLWQRALIVLAGPVMNFLVAIAFLATFNLAYGKLVVPPVVGGVEAASAADRAGIRPGDRIVSMDGVPVTQFQQLSERTIAAPGDTLTLGVERDGRKFTLDLTIPSISQRDRFGNEFRIGKLGMFSTSGELVAVGPVEAVSLGVQQTAGITVMMVKGIGQIITGRRSVTELGGPVKIAKFSGEQLSLGWQAFASFVALVSINLAFINLLPIPGLDGGHLAFYAAEAVRRRPASPRSQEWAFRTGMALVLALMLFVTINDLASLSIFGG